MNTHCFMDKARPCAAECKAFDAKTSECRLLERSATVSRAFKVLMSWLGQRDPPKV